MPADGRRGCQLKEAETSVGRRFSGSFANKPVLASIDIGRLVKDFLSRSVSLDSRLTATAEPLFRRGWLP